MPVDDKTLGILRDETWPGVPGPSCLGPWTGNQELRAVGIGPRTRVLPSALRELSWGWMVLLGPAIQQQGALSPVRAVEPQDHGPGALANGPCALHTGASVLG